MHTPLRVVPWFALVLLAGCASSTPVDRLGNDYLDVTFAANPIAGTIAGRHDYDGRPVDLSAQAIRRHHAELQRIDGELATLLASDPDTESSLRARALKSTIDGELFTIDVLRAPRRDPAFYAYAVDVSVYAKRDFAPEARRMRGAASVLECVPRVVLSARANLEPVLPRVAVETAIEIAEGQADFMEHDLLMAFEHAKDTEAKASLEAAAAAAAASMRVFAEWLRAERLPKSTGDFAIGADAFAQLLHGSELIDTPLDRILAIGQRELETQTRAFTDAARTIDPNTPAPKVWEAIQHDHPTPETLLPDTRAHLGEIRQFLVDENLIGFPTRNTVMVEETPAFLRATTFASMDTPGPFEKTATESFYYVTPPNAEWDAAQTEEWLTAFNYYTTDVVSIHEAYPGHFEQAMHLMVSPMRGAFRYIGSYAFVEGWAHYCEQMALDEGFPPASLRTDPHAAAKYRMAQADEALLRICRLICAIRMHTQGMTIDEATRFFVDHCYYSETASHAEAVRAAVEPSVCLYTIGKLQLLSLRTAWKAQEGNRFTLKRFHDEVLRFGQPPVRLLRERMLTDPAQWSDSLPE